MDYEKAYKEALKFIKDCIPDENGFVHVYPEELFPELRESEDDRIRKEFCKDIWTFIPNEKAHKYIAWLEKQGGIDNCPLEGSVNYVTTDSRKQDEQKPEKKELEKIKNHPMLSDFFNAEYERGKADALKCVEWSDEDKLQLQAAIEICENSGHTITSNWLKSLKNRVYPKQEWTKEDKERYISCLQRLGTGNPDQPETINSKWFKEHITFLPKRKPSDEQMHYLANVKLGDNVVEQEVSKTP